MYGLSVDDPDRDVMERMIKAGCAATSDFEWLSQLRFVFSREDGPFGMVSVRQTNCQLEYSYEYQVGCVSLDAPTCISPEGVLIHMYV